MSRTSPPSQSRTSHLFNAALPGFFAYSPTLIASMLGLRKSLGNVRRKPKGSTSSSLISDGPDENSPSRAVMDAIRQGLSDSLSNLTITKSNLKAPDCIITVNEIDSSSSDSEEVTTSSLTVLSNGTSPSSTDIEAHGSVLEHFDRIKDVFRSVNNLICRLDGYDKSFVKTTDLHTYLEFISDERLVHMPRRGSDWDRVLGAAQFFGLQIWSFGTKIENFVHGGKDLASAALASSLILLDVGQKQAPALVPTFIALYEMALLLSSVGQIQSLEHMPVPIKESTADIFCDLVDLSSQISVHYREKITGLRAGSIATVNFDTTFGKQINRIWQSKQVLHDRIWSYKLGGKRPTVSLKSLRRKLESSSEFTIRTSLYDEVAESLERSEDTCHWIKNDLIQFFGKQSQVLSITGSTGTGKTVLAEWVSERLARPLDRKTYAVLEYKFPFDSPSEATALACVKSLLSQLLERSVGDVALYEHVAAAFDSYTKNNRSEVLEASLWKALQSGLRAAERDNVTFVILTDGCDTVAGGDKKALDFHNALRKCVAGLAHIKVVTFSASISHISEGCEHLLITRQETHEDVKAHFWQTLTRSPHFGKLAISTREQLVQDLTVKAKGSFIWAFHVGRLLVREPSHEALVAAVQSVSTDVSKVLKAIVDKLQLERDGALQNLMSFMLVAHRSLTVSEASELLTINLQKRSMNATSFDISKFVSDKCSDIIFIRGGQLHFRSTTARSYIKQLQGDQLLSVKDAHHQLTLRLLLYARLHLEVGQDLAIEGLAGEAVDDIIGSHHLLGYAVQGWIAHFKASSLFAGDRIALGQGFADLFPDSVVFGLLERSCWHSGFSSQEYAAHIELSLQIRETCLGSQHISVLQSLITLGQIHHKILVSVDSAARYFYKAAVIGRTILTATSVIVASCTSLFLTCTEAIVITERTEIITYREEMIQLMIQICRHRHGESSDEVITWYEKLAKLYIEIKEEFRATVIYRELYALVVLRYGKKSPRARQIGGVFGTLDIVLRGEEGEKNIDELEYLIFETSEDMEISDQLCITMLLRLAQSYFACGRIYLAERLYITLWRRISSISGVNVSIEVHTTKIQIALEYVKFLRKLKRSEEATNILICLWAEYEHFSCEVQSLIIWIREIGTVCRSFGLLSIAVSILTKVWGWFKSKGKSDDDEAQHTTILITEVVEEITETTVTEKTTTITTTEVTETVIKEIFELHLTRCRKTKVDKSFFSACMALIGLFTKQQRWTEAEVVIRRTLEITWKAILSADIKISLSEHLATESVRVAIRLALCYRHQGFFEKAEEIHLRIYYACFYANVQDETLLDEAITVLIAFYEAHHRHEKMIEIYQEVLVKYRKTLGAHHHRTIKILYLLATQCELLGRKDTYEYYLEIVTVLNKGRLSHCHHDAVRAALFLSRHYHTRKMYIELGQICAAVWETIVHHHKGCELTMEIITEIYEKYTFVLEVHAKVEFSVLYKLSVQYKETVTVIFGNSSSKVLIALIALAKMCERHESHYHESVTIYEEVIKKTTTTKTTETTITERTVQTVKKRLSKLYVTIIISGKTSTTTTTSFDRAIEICIEAYESLKLEFGCWHEETLLKLKDIVILYQKVATKAAHARMVQLLQVAVTEVITTLTVTASLFAAAQTLASIYIDIGLLSQGQDLLHQLRHIIIFHSDVPLSDVTLRLDVKVSKVAFAFLIAFEQTLVGKSSTVSYSLIMADILLESVLYEEYSRVIEGNSKLEVILECGARLRCFWEEQKRTQLLVILDKKLIQLFKTGYGTIFEATSDEAVRHFYLCLLLELGKDRQSSKLNWDLLAIRAGNNKVKTLLVAGEFRHAYEVGRSVFRYAKKQQLYRRRESLQFGYKLAEYLAGIDVSHPTGDSAAKQELKKAMLSLSREIMAEVLAAFRAEKTDFSSLRFDDLAGLIRLLGAQSNFGELEVLLSHLWSSREHIHTNGWSPSMVLQIGKLLVLAQYAHGNASAAIDTAELLYYNMRRGRGRLDSQTLDVAKLLASLYTSERRMTSAMGVHDAVLRELASVSQHDEDAGMQRNRAVLVAEAKRHLELLRAVHHRMQGWTKPVAEYKSLYSRLTTVLKLELPSFEQWLSIGKDQAAKVGAYVATGDWKIQGNVEDCVMWKRCSRDRTKTLDVVSAASQWWLVY